MIWRMKLSALALPLVVGGLLPGMRAASAESGLSFPALPSPVPLSFQQKLAGMVPTKTRELRWVLSFADKTARLSATLRSCPLALRRAELPPCREPAAQAVAYVGKWQARPYGMEVWLESSAAPEGFPSELSLLCLRTVVGVLPAGASLLPGDACDGSSPPPRWQPGQTKDVALWHCAIQSDDARPWSGYGNIGPFAFAGGAGVEWLYVNNDCAGQEGAFRFPAPAR